LAVLRRRIEHRRTILAYRGSGWCTAGRPKFGIFCARERRRSEFGGKWRGALELPVARATRPAAAGAQETTLRGAPATNASMLSTS
jgi:hypothetical protein